MKFTFHKYHGTGNDFILIDNRDEPIHLSAEEIALLCDRHFGIGADGLMFLTTEPGFDFGMKYYNSDGRESTLCGNGGRCITAFASTLGIIERNARFIAFDGEHQSEILYKSGSSMQVKLKMSDVPASGIRHPVIQSSSDPVIQIDTGSPHLLLLRENVEEIDVVTEGRMLRNDPQFAPHGINVDFVEVRDGSLFVRTYERGVEDETLSCGTGVTAAAIAVGSKQWTIGSGQSATGKIVIARNEVTKQTPTVSNIKIETLGGKLTVSFREEGDSFTDIWLEGPAKFVFKGEYTI